MEEERAEEEEVEPEADMLRDGGERWEATWAVRLEGDDIFSKGMRDVVGADDEAEADEE